jgi:hypothetical protein
MVRKRKKKKKKKKKVESLWRARVRACVRALLKIEYSFSYGAEFQRKCDEAAGRLFGADHYCAVLAMEPFGELIPESFDAIRDGDKITAQVRKRTAPAAALSDSETVLSPDDWKSMRESHINDKFDFQSLVSKFGGGGGGGGGAAGGSISNERRPSVARGNNALVTTSSGPARKAATSSINIDTDPPRRSRSLGDVDDDGGELTAEDPASEDAAGRYQMHSSAPPVPLSPRSPRGPGPAPMRRTASLAVPARKPTRPVGAPPRSIGGAGQARSPGFSESEDFESVLSETPDISRESMRTISAKLEDIDEEMARISAELNKTRKPTLTKSEKSDRNDRSDNIAPAPSSPRAQVDLDVLDDLLNGDDESDTYKPVAADRSRSPGRGRPAGALSDGAFTRSAPARGLSPGRRGLSPGRSGQSSPGPPPKPQKSEQALMRAEQLKRGRSNARLIELSDLGGVGGGGGGGSPAMIHRQPSGRTVGPASPMLSRNASHGSGATIPSRMNGSAAMIPNTGGRTYGGGGGGAASSSQLPHMPSRPPLFDGLPAPLLLPALSKAVTKTSGPFACPVCFKSYPIAADVCYHVQKRHEVDIGDAAAVNDANARYHSTPQLMRSNDSGQQFELARSKSTHSLSAGAVDEQLPPGWARVWSKSKQKFYYYNERTGQSIWTLAGVYAAK